MPPLPQQPVPGNMPQAPPQAAPLMPKVPRPATAVPVEAPNLPLQLPAGGFREAPETTTEPKQAGPAVDWEGALPGVAQKYGLQEDLIRRVIKQESSGNPAARSPKGAFGLMQLMPATAQRLGVDPNDPLQNLDGGARELRRLLDKYQHYGKALAAYNAGEGVVDRLANQPGGFNGLPEETRNYINAIMDGYQPPQQAQAAQAAPAAQGTSMQGAPVQQQPDLGMANRFGAYAQLGERLKQGLTAPGTLFGPPSTQEQQQAEATKALIAGGPGTLGQQFAQLQAQPGAFMDPGAALGLSPAAPFSPQAAGLVKPGTVAGGAAEAAAGLASPAGIAQLAILPASKLINMLYTGVMGKDTFDAIMQGHQLAAQGNHGAAKEAYGHALVSGGMTLLTALGLRPAKQAAEMGTRPGPIKGAAEPGVSMGQDVPRTQVTAPQEPSIAQEGGPRPVTSPGISGGREIGGAEPRAAVSTPLETTGTSAGRGLAKPTGREITPVGGIPPSETLEQAVGRARATGLMPDLRKQAGQPPAGMPERRTATERTLAEMAATPPGHPTAGEQLSQQMRQEQASTMPRIPDEMKGLVVQRILRDPTLYQQWKAADERGQIQIATQVRDQILAQQKAQQTLATKEPTGAQRSTGPTEAPAPTAPATSGQPLPAASAKTPTYKTGESLRSGQEPVREPVRAQQIEPRAKTYTSLPPEQRPRVPARPLSPSELGPEPRVQGFPQEKSTPEAREKARTEAQQTAKDRNEWLKQRAQTAPTKEALLEATRGPAAEAAATLDRTLTRHLKTQETGGRQGEIDAAVKREIAKGPEAAQAAAQAMTDRADVADGKLKTVEHLLSKPTQEWDKEMRELLGKPLTEIYTDPKTGVSVERLARKEGDWLTQEGTKGGTRGRGKVRRELDAIAAEIFNDLRGNIMREVGTERRVPLDAEAQANLADQQAQYQALLKEVRGQEGHRPTDEQLAKLKNLMAGIHALRQTRMLAESGPGSEPVGTAVTNKFWNALMGRSEGSHLGKPSPELLQARLNELRAESAKAREVAEQLRAGTPEAPKAPAEAPRPLKQLAGREEPAARGDFNKEEQFISGLEKRSDEELGKWWRTPGREYQSLELTKRLQNAPQELKARWNTAKERAQRMFEEIGIREGSIPAPKATSEPVSAADAVRHGQTAERRFREEGVTGLEKLSPTELQAASKSPQISSALYKALQNEIASRGASKTPAKAPERPVEAPKPAQQPVSLKPVPEAAKTPAIAKKTPSGDRAELQALRKQVSGQLDRLNAADPFLNEAGSKDTWSKLDALLKQIDAKLGPKKAPAATAKPKGLPAAKFANAELEASFGETPEIRAAAKRQLEAEQPLKGAGVPAPKMQEAIRREISKPHVERPAESPKKPIYSTGEKAKEPLEVPVEPKGPSIQKQIVDAANASGAEGLGEFTSAELRRAKEFVGATTQATIDQVLKSRESEMAKIAKEAPKTTPAVQAPKRAEHVAVSVEPAAGTGGKTDNTREELYNLGARIDKLPAGEDRNDLAQHINTVSKQFESLSEKIKWTSSAIRDMREHGRTTRLRTVDGKKVTETLEQLENRVRNLGLERMRLMDEHLPTLKNTISALEKAPVPKAPAETPTKIEPVKMPTYGPAEVVHDPQTGKYVGTIPGEKTGEKVVMPSPAPKEEGVQAKLDRLATMEKHLANAQLKWATPNRGQAIFMSKLQKGIKAIRANLGKDAPGITPSAESTLLGTRLLGKPEARPKPEPEILEPRATTYTTGEVGTNSDDLMDHLRAQLSGKSTAKDSAQTIETQGGKIVEAIQRLHDNTVEEGRDKIAEPILKAIRDKTLTPEKAAGRYGRALDVYNKLLKTKELAAAKTDAEKDAIRATRDPQALAKAQQIASTGRLEDPLKGQAGMAGDPALRKKVVAVQDKLFGKKAAEQRDKGPSLMERMRETSDAFRASRLLDEGLEERRFQQQGMRQRFMQGLKELPKVPGLQQFMYKGKERGAEFQAEMGRVFDEHIRDWADLAEQRYHQLRTAGHDVENYVPRVAIKKNTMWDRVLRGTGQYTMGSVLRQTANSLKGRKFFRLEAPGLPVDTVVHVGDGGDLTLWDQGKPVPLGVTRKEMEASGAKFGTAVSDDITRHSGQEYLQHLYIATATNAMNLDNAWRAHEFLEAYKASPEFKQYAVQSGPNDPVPDGFSTTKVPQLQGYAFEKHTADVLNRYYDQLVPGSSNFLDKFNYGLMSTIYWNPLKHTKNIIDHWATNHGLSTFLRPNQYLPMAKAFKKAWKAVWEGNNDYLYALDNGMPLRGRMVTNQQMTEGILKELNPLQMRKNPKTGQMEFTPAAEGIAKAWGYVNPVRLYKSYMNVQRRGLFGLDDILRLQATYHHQALTGDSFHASWREVSKHLPDYTLPTHVGLRLPFTNVDVTRVGKIDVGRMLAKMFDNKLVIFGRYHYGRLKSYGYMAEDMFSANVPNRERLKAMDRLFVPAVSMAIYYTLGTAIAKKLTGKPKAEMTPTGATYVPWTIMRLLQGRTSIGRAAMGTFTPNPLVDLAARMGYGELSKPKPIGQQIKEASKGLFGEIGPVREAEQTKRGIAGQVDWGEMGRRAALNVYVPKSGASRSRIGPPPPHLPRMPK